MGEQDLAILRVLRMRGVIGTADVATAMAVGKDSALQRLLVLEEAGLVELRTGRPAGWAVTTFGREQLAAGLARELDAGGHRLFVTGCYERFDALNGAFKELCTRWQLHDLDVLRPNDHSDPAYDAALVAQLVEIHGQLESLLGDLAGAFPHFGAYADRLSAALGRLRAGGLEWFTKPGMGSYHDVWMELHEDLLLTLGRTRGEGDT